MEFQPALVAFRVSCQSTYVVDQHLPSSFSFPLVEANSCFAGASLALMDSPVLVLGVVPVISLQGFFQEEEGVVSEVIVELEEHAFFLVVPLLLQSVFLFCVFGQLLV